MGFWAARAEERAVVGGSVETAVDRHSGVMYQGIRPSDVSVQMQYPGVDEQCLHRFSSAWCCYLSDEMQSWTETEHCLCLCLTECGMFLHTRYPNCLSISPVPVRYDETGRAIGLMASCNYFVPFPLFRSPLPPSLPPSVLLSLFYLT